MRGRVRTPKACAKHSRRWILESFSHARHKHFRLRGVRTAELACAQDAGGHSAISRRLALQPQLYRAIAKESPGRSRRVLSGGRNFWRGGTSRSRISTSDLRFRSGTGHRSCCRNFQSAPPLGSSSEIQFHRLPLSRAGVSQPARAGHELLQYLLQPAWRTYLAALFASGKFSALRRAELDDHRKTNLVHRRTSL